MSTSTIVSVQVAPARAWQDGSRTYLSAIVKSPVATSAWASALGVDGDEQADDKHHGGPDRAVLAYAESHYALWRAAHPDAEFPIGCFGENVTLSGLDEATVCVGDRYAVGELLLEVTYPRIPCFKLNGATATSTMLTEVVSTGRIGWFHRVLAEGPLTPHAAFERVARPHPGWPIARAYAVYKALQAGDATVLEDARTLATLPELAAGWRSGLPIMIERLEARLAR
jgi:MOSC domain-containing protein YiiM